MYRKPALSAIAVWIVAMAIPSIGFANETEKQAQLAIAEFFEAFNAEDNERLQSVMQYPHVFFGQGANVSIAEQEFVTDFGALKAREDWKFSTLNSAKSVFTRPDKAHMLVTFTRHNSKGEIYREVEGMWIVTKKDDRWGVSARSY